MDGNPRRNGIPVANRSHHDGQPPSKLTRVILANMNSNLLSRRNVWSLIRHINKDVIVSMLSSALAQFNELVGNGISRNSGVRAREPRFGIHCELTTDVDLRTNVQALAREGRRRA